VPDDRAAAVLRALDKIDREDPSTVREALEREGLAGEAAQALYSLIATKRTTHETLDTLRRFEARNELLEQGLRSWLASLRRSASSGFRTRRSASTSASCAAWTTTRARSTRPRCSPTRSWAASARAGAMTTWRATSPNEASRRGNLHRIDAPVLQAEGSRAAAAAPRTPAEVLVTTMDSRYQDRYLAVARSLRAAGINTEVYLETAKLKQQLSYADRKGFRVALIAGENEFARSTMQVKNLSAKTAQDYPVAEVVAAVKHILGMH
jgi:histidyl-tRNA synthetase